MLRNGENLNTIDPGKTLHGEHGLFEVRSPGGENFRVECRQGQSIYSFVSVDYPNQNWTIQKIADLPQQETAEGTSRGRTRAAGGSA